AKLLFVLRSSLAPGSLPGPRRAGCWFGSGGRARCAGGRGSLLRGRVAGGFQRGSTLDDPGEHPAGVAALRRPVRLPDGRRVFGEDVLEIALALHAAGGEFRDVEVAGPVVAMLDQQPASIAAAARTGKPAAGPHEHP